MTDDVASLLEAESAAVEDAEERAALLESSAGDASRLSGNVTVTRGHPRARNLQVRLRDDEYLELARYAEAQGLPVSTVVRAIVLRAIAPADDLRSAFDRLEADVEMLRRTALGA